ncbi:MAG TPA: GNAT family N-acetyltransferase [Gammaproteobacteria bacterium]|nr:GNAT family N-acetyltransferase [Gammaproteobacteria bacterium]
MFIREQEGATVARLMQTPAAPLAAGTSVQEIDCGEALASLRDPWSELLRASASNGIFLTWEWLVHWWQQLGHVRGRLRVLVVRRAGRIIAIAPLIERERQPGRLWPFRTLEFMGMGSVGSDYLDFLVRAGEEAPAVAALTDRLARERTVFEFRRVAAGSPMVLRVARRLEERGWTVTEGVEEACPYVRLEGHDWESYLASLGSAHRQNLRRCLRRIERDFEPVFEEVETEAQRSACLKVFENLHRQRWDARGGSDALTGEAVMRFHDTFSRLALERGWLRLSVLRLSGRPAAAVYAFCYANVVHYYQAGFDPAFRRYSVGLAAMGLGIRAAIAQGLGEYDLLHGAEAYKSLWARNRRELLCIRCFPPGLRGFVPYRTERLREVLKALRRRVPGPARQPSSATGARP